MLLKWVNEFKKKPERTFVVHGEEEVSLKFADTLREQGLADVKVPELGETCEI
jgi:metallo-beta-lactamase family protein